MIHKLEVDSVSLEFGTRKILTDIYLKCTTGSITGLLGRNGEGKSCLLNVIYGTQKAYSKSIRFDDISVYEAFKRTELLTFLPQFNFLPNFLSVQRVFTDFNISYKDFETYFPEFEKNKNSRIKNLSAGNKRLLEVYLILKTESKFSILDEPFTHLTPLQIEKIIALLMEAKITKGFLLTDHLYRHLFTVCDEIYVLNNGRICISESIEDLRIFGYLNLY